MARVNDLERGFEKTLAYAYGIHVVQGHLIMHNIDILGTDKQVTLLMALGDGAYNNTGEGAWGACLTGPDVPPAPTLSTGHAYVGSYYPPNVYKINTDDMSTYASCIVSEPSATLDSNFGSMAQDDTYVYFCATNPVRVQRVRKSDMSYDYSPVIGTVSPEETEGFGSNVSDSAIMVDDNYIYVGFDTNDTATDSITSRLHRLHKSDFSTQDILALSGTGGGIFCMAQDSSYVYLVSMGHFSPASNDFAVKIDKSTFTVSNTLDLGARGVTTAQWGGVEQDSTYVYLAGDVVRKVTKSSWTLDSSHDISHRSYVLMLDGSNLWAAVLGGTDRVIVYDKTSFSVVHSITLPDTATGVIRIEQDPDYVYLLQGESGPARVTKIAKSDYSIVDTFNTDLGDYLYSMVVDSPSLVTTADYDAAVLVNTPLFYGKLQELSLGAGVESTPIVDSSGSGNDGWYLDSSYGGTVGASGPLETYSPSYAASGPIGYLYAPDGGPLDMHRTQTWEAWSKTDGGDVREIINHGGSYVAFGQHSTGLYTGNVLWILSFPSGGYGLLSPAISFNVWHHIACVYNYDTRSAYLYVDGCLADSRTDLPAEELSIASSERFRFGYIPNLVFGPVDWSYGLAYVALYDQALTAVDIFEHYANGVLSPVSCPTTPLAVNFCPGVRAVYYAGRLIDPSNWHYHPGLFSTGADDPIQGIDSFFPEGLTYSGTAYIAIRLPVGVAEDADPSKVAIILNTSCVADYDSAGNLTKIDYSANPARVKADMLKRRGQHTRINWDSYVQARDWYDALIPWSAGDVVNDYTDVSAIPTYTLSGNIQGSGGTLSKSSATTGWDNTAKTQERIVYGQDGYFQITIGAAFPTFTGGGTMHLIDSAGKVWFGIAWGNGHLSIFANSVAIDDTTIPYDFPATTGDVIKLAVESGEFKLYQNGVEKVPPQGVSLVPLDTDLYGRVQLYWSTAAVSASFFQGQTVVTSTQNVSQVKRMEAHPAFTAPVDLVSALDFVDSLCASDTQDAGDEIIFLTPATPSPRTSVFTFDESSNVIDLKVYRRDIRERPNRLSAQFRNINKVYLDQDEVFDSRDTLFDEVGYTVDPGALNFASMNASQAQRLIRYQMRRLSDNDFFCDVVGMADSFKLLPGDIVTVVSEKMPDGAPKDFIIITATRESGESTAYERTFTLQEWYADDYSDTDHGPEQAQITDPLPSPYEPPDAPVVVID